MIKKYSAVISLEGKPKKVEFETDKLPVEWLWTQYGMTTYISSVVEIVDGENREISDESDTSDETNNDTREE